MEAGFFSFTQTRTHKSQVQTIKQHLRLLVKQFDSTFHVIFFPHHVMLLFYSVTTKSAATNSLNEHTGCNLGRVQSS